jgi:hypothetical protein
MAGMKERRTVDASTHVGDSLQRGTDCRGGVAVEIWGKALTRDNGQGNNLAALYALYGGTRATLAGGGTVEGTRYLLARWLRLSSD